ncbi:MAG: hypothetical protein KDK45_09000 [Leptospiraceae bacterium]|nr:hypothetical protein [Leptospiraceae bacterium]
MVTLEGDEEASEDYDYLYSLEDLSDVLPLAGIHSCLSGYGITLSGDDELYVSNAGILVKRTEAGFAPIAELEGEIAFESSSELLGSDTEYINLYSLSDLLDDNPELAGLQSRLAGNTNSLSGDSDLLISEDGHIFRSTINGIVPLAEIDYNPILLNGFNLGKMFKGFKMPKFKLPKLTMPKLPKIKMPKLPKIKLPKIKLPKIKLPKIKLPKIKLPKIKLPKFKLPKIKLPKIDFSGIGKGITNFGKGTAKIFNDAGKGLAKFGDNAGKAVQQYMEYQNQMWDSTLNAVTGILGPGGGQAGQYDQNGAEGDYEQVEQDAEQIQQQANESLEELDRDFEEQKNTLTADHTEAIEALQAEYNSQSTSILTELENLPTPETEEQAAELDAYYDALLEQYQQLEPLFTAEFEKLDSQYTSNMEQLQGQYEQAYKDLQEQLANV